MHYGIKGMKWGVRRSKKELLYNPNSVSSVLNKKLSSVKTPNGVKINKVSQHFIDRLLEDRKDRKVTANDVIDALTKPKDISPVKYNDKNQPSIRYIGKKATVNVNPENGIVTTYWNTGKSTLAKIEKKGK